MSLMEGLSIGRRGLSAAQIAIDVTGQNISNANTDGYSRKSLTQVSDYRTDGTYGQMGFGVDVVSVNRVRDVFIDRQLNSQIADQGYTTDLDAAYQRIENVHQEPSTTGLNETMDTFWNAWSDLSNNPSDKSARESLKSTAQVLTDRFHYTANEMTSYQNSINDQVQSYVGQINDIADKISSLNKTIVAAEGAQNDNANDARDQRDQLIKQLSSYVKIDYTEDKSGAVSVTASGNMLISPQTVFHLETTRQDVHDASGANATFYGVKFEHSDTAFVPQSGKLKAMFDTRDVVIPSYMNDLNAMTATMVKAVNTVHESGYTMDKTTGVDFFDPANTTAATISLSAAVINDSNSIAAAAGGTIQSVVMTGATVPPTPASDANNIVNLTSASAQFRNLAQGSVVVTDPVSGTVLQEGSSKDYVVDYDLGRVRIVNSGTYPAGTVFNINFKYNDTGYSGTGDGNNALAISQVRDTKNMNFDQTGAATSSIAENYAGYIGRLGVERSQAKFISTISTMMDVLEKI